MQACRQYHCGMRAEASAGSKTCPVQVAVAASANLHKKTRHPNRGTVPSGVPRATEALSAPATPYV